MRHTETGAGCPRCGSLRLIIAGAAEARLHVVIDPADDDQPVQVLRIKPTGSYEWRDDTWAACAQCGHRADLKEFHLPQAAAGGTLEPE